MVLHEQGLLIVKQIVSRVVDQITKGFVASKDRLLDVHQIASRVVEQIAKGFVNLMEDSTLSPPLFEDGFTIKTQEWITNCSSSDKTNL
jgi:hypothetical protein